MIFILELHEKKCKRVIGCLLILISIMGCSSSELSVAQYMIWMEDVANNYKIQKQLDDFDYQVQYKTPEYMAIKDIGTEMLTEKTFQKQKNKYDDMYFFDLILSSGKYPNLLKAGANKEVYYSRIRYYTTEVAKDINLISGSDTLNFAMVHFERSYGITPYIKLVLAFEKGAVRNEKLHLVYNDRVFNTGKVRFDIATPEATPILKF